MPTEALYQADEIPVVFAHEHLERGLVDRAEFRIRIAQKWAGAFIDRFAGVNLGRELWARHRNDPLRHGRKTVRSPFAFKRSARWNRGGVRYGLVRSREGDRLWNLSMEVSLNGVLLIKQCLIDQGLYFPSGEPTAEKRRNYIDPRCTSLPLEQLSRLCFSEVVAVLRVAVAEFLEYAVIARGGEVIPEEAVVVDVREIEVAVDRWVRGIEVGSRMTDAGTLIRAWAPNWRVSTGGWHEPDKGWERLVAVFGPSKIKAYEGAPDSCRVRGESVLGGDDTRGLGGPAVWLEGPSFRERVLQAARPLYDNIVDATSVMVRPLDADLLTPIGVIASAFTRKDFDREALIRVLPAFVRAGAFSARTAGEKKAFPALRDADLARYDSRAGAWRPTPKLLELVRSLLAAEKIVLGLYPQAGSSAGVRPRSPCSRLRPANT